MLRADRTRHAPLTALVAVALAVASMAVATTPATVTALAANQLTVQLVVGGLSQPLGVVNAGDGSGRLFIVGQRGTVRVVQGSRLLPSPFLNVSVLIDQGGGEKGLLGLAFHPDFETNRELFIYYNRPTDGAIVISRLTANTAKTSAPSSSEVVLMVIDHPGQTNHNGGSMAFGPDGYLYIGVGDGGGTGDPDGNAQDIGAHLGKILRLDVDGTGSGPNNAYGIPADNPFVGKTGLDEIWAYGVRNPWRLSFDRTTHDLFIADVGQASWEEIDRQPAAATGGANYGWNVLEGQHCYNADTCDASGKTAPVAEYGHDLGCSITGGYVYRGFTQKALQGLYVFGDFCTGRIWTMPHDGSAITQRLDLDNNISSFGESESGELYMVDNIDGTLFRVLAPEFSDIAANAFIDDIHWLFYAAITNGCGGTLFCPDAPVTRGQMATFLARALELPTTTTDYFDDDTGNTHEQDINRVAKAGISSGCGTRQFCPDDDVTRGQMASFLARGFALPASTTNYFTDDNGTTHEIDINRVAKAGITSGCTPTTYCPAATVTRGQMAAFLHRALD